MLTKTIRGMRSRARKARGGLFLRSFVLGRDTKILDLGCGDGTNIANILNGSSVVPQNVYVADIGSQLDSVAARFGFVPVPIPESGRLPFSDQYFDIVFCSSVIEHVTVPKSQVWRLRSGKEFKARAFARQSEMAMEINRLSAQYFVQTPNKWFLVESHTWLPFMGWLPRRVLLPILRLTNRMWIKKTIPDWSLLTKDEMATLFPGAEIYEEKSFGLTKSIVAIKKS